MGATSWRPALQSISLWRHDCRRWLIAERAVRPESSRGRLARRESSPQPALHGFQRLMSSRILSFDQDFEGLPGISRLDRYPSS